MKKTGLLTWALFLTLSGLLAQKEPVVMTIDGKPVYKSEFVNIYEKNNPNPDYSKAAIDDYIDLFINFKLKVREAENLKYDTISKLINELEGYREQLSQPYLTDNKMNEELIKETYERLKKEIRASHILIRLKPEATPTDTLKAYEKISELRKRILAGESFEEVAKGPGGSEDPSVVQNGGDLGYFTALQMVYPFEEVAYNTKIGEVSMPVRTRFGYHIIQVNDIRESRGSMEASHIMVMVQPNATEEERANAEKKVNEIYEKLEQGEKFEELAIKYSDDNSSKYKGGKLPRFGGGTNQRMVREFEEAAFSIKENNGYSKPFQTMYGWHIVKRNEHFPLDSYENMKGELKNRINRDGRSEITKIAFINKLKKEYKFKDASEKMVKELIPTLDSSIFKHEWKAPKSVKSKTLFSFNKRKYTSNEFLSYLENNQRRYAPNLSTLQANASTPPAISFEDIIQRALEEYSEYELISYEKSILENKYPEFKNLMKEYRDGILLFEITEDKVWGKAVKDTVGLEKFYQANISNYQWPTRYNLNYFDCDSKEIAQEVYQMLLDSVPTDSIISKVNKTSSLNASFKKGLVGNEEFPEMDLSSIKNETIIKPFEKNEKHFVVQVLNVEEPRAKKLDEARGIVTSAYQTHLEKEWLQHLRNKYKVELNTDVLYNLK